MWYVVGGIALLLVIWLIASYNNLIKKKNVVEESFSTMDVYMKKRFDLIPNVVETVKGYAKHESETLEKVIAARNRIASGGSNEDRLKAENALTGTLKSLFALAEAYPELKANTNFTSLQNQLASIEGEIASSRKYYNACVKEFNTKTQTFPSVIVANMFHFTRFPLFELDSPEERKNVKVQF
ncbi:MAG TPA: hypothetical protein DCY74_07430 [Clostridiales bacterium]|jgi:LemA protein|nr:hypothetical protein [Clostridiales bacterium]